MSRLDGVKLCARAAVPTLLAIVILLSGSLQWLERLALNVQFSLRGPQSPRSPIVIVSIDEDSFDEFELTWPWPRALHGQLLDIISEGKPAAIGLDILFSEPSSKGEPDDAALGQAVGRAGNVVLGAALTVVKEKSFVKEDLNPPIKLVRDRAAGFGIVNFSPDDDGFVRTGLLGISHQSAEVPSFDLQLHRLGVRAGIPSAPLPKPTHVLINYRGRPGTFLTVPYHAVIGGQVSPEEFRGRIVLVGAVSPVLHDIFPTPYASQGMPGVEIHANVLETLFQGIALTRVSRLALFAFVLGAGVLAIWATNLAGPLWGLALLVGAELVYSGAGFAAFAWGHVWVDQVPVPLALVLGYGTTVVWSFFEVQREKQRLARFFSPSILRHVVRQRHQLASSRRVVTVLFSDIRGFTTISEKLSPEVVAELLRGYLTNLTDVVFKHGGTVDKFIGDAIMALYNAPFDQPDHAARAVRTALEFQEHVKVLSEHWEAKCGAPLKTGVGINTGDAMVGALGSAQRLEYTALGDTINLGSRLESVTKQYDTSIIISESTYQAVKDLFYCRYLGEVVVKGKARLVKIYSVDREDRRGASRLALEVPLTITDPTGESRTPEPASLSDLSVTGLGATRVPRLLATEQTVGLRFELPGPARPISAEGRVRWSAAGQAGIALLGVSPDDRRLLEEFLEKGQVERVGRAPDR